MELLCPPLVGKFSQSGKNGWFPHRKAAYQSQSGHGLFPFLPGIDPEMKLYCLSGFPFHLELEKSQTQKAAKNPDLPQSGRWNWLCLLKESFSYLL